MTGSLLPDRAIIAVTGADAETLLNRLFTNSVLAMASGAARYAALLSPQGKVLYDFLVYRTGDGFWLDCRRDQAADLARKLAMFRLRAEATIAFAPDLAVAAIWGDASVEDPRFRDPRHDDLGLRIVATAERLTPYESQASDYRRHRIGLGVPEGGTDWAYGDTFVHDANIDLLHGVDFEKGCYVGQEVVSRVHHRGAARKRIAQVRFDRPPPAVGTELVAGETRLGHLTSLDGQVGLASVRIDRLAEVAGLPITAGDASVEITLPPASP